MLMRYGMLSQDEAIGAALRRGGVLAMVLAVLAGAWVLRVMATTPVGNRATPP
jgi:hypothetical protein